MSAIKAVVAAFIKNNKKKVKYKKLPLQAAKRLIMIKMRQSLSSYSSTISHLTGSGWFTIDAEGKNLIFAKVNDRKADDYRYDVLVALLRAG
jgi:hypothetical protein